MWYLDEGLPFGLLQYQISILKAVFKHSLSRHSIHGTQFYNILSKLKFEKFVFENYVQLCTYITTCKCQAILMRPFLRRATCV
jgi:hypothetical protein